VDHIIELGHLAVGICQDGEIQRLSLGLLDIALPARVAVERVNREADRLDLALVPVRLETRDFRELGGADRGVIPGMAE
jgi:hypothetical protein